MNSLHILVKKKTQMTKINPVPNNKPILCDTVEVTGSLKPLFDSAIVTVNRQDVRSSERMTSPVLGQLAVVRGSARSIHTPWRVSAKPLANSRGVSLLQFPVWYFSKVECIQLIDMSFVPYAIQQFNYIQLFNIIPVLATCMKQALLEGWFK